MSTGFLMEIFHDNTQAIANGFYEVHLLKNK